MQTTKFTIEGFAVRSALGCRWLSYQGQTRDRFYVWFVPLKSIVAESSELVHADALLRSNKSFSIFT
jgi:hypothetical protein